MKMNSDKKYSYDDIKNCLNLMETHWYIKELTLSKGLNMSEGFLKSSIDTLNSILCDENESTIFDSHHLKSKKTINISQCIELHNEYFRLKERVEVTLKQYEAILKIKLEKEVG